MKKIVKSSILALSVLFAVFCTPLTAHAALLSIDNPNAVAYYNALPDIVKYKMELAGVNIAVDTNAVNSLSDGRDLNGITNTWYNPDNNQITSQSIYVKSGREASIIHEAGHAMESYQNQFKYWTRTDAWNYIYATEVGNAIPAGMSSSNLYNPSEYFAESFKLFINNPNSLATYCPMTYQYVTAAVMAP